MKQHRFYSTNDWGVIKATKIVRTFKAPRKTRTKNTDQNEASSATNGTHAVAIALKPNDAPMTRRGPKI